MSTQTPDSQHPLEDLGRGEPPPEMVEIFGMEAVPEEGESDEGEGEVVDLDTAEAESEAAATK